MKRGKKWLINGAYENIDEDVEKKLYGFAWQTYHTVRTVICICELLLLAVSCSRKGGPFISPMRKAYFGFYVSMLLVTLFFIALDILWYVKRIANSRLYFNLGFAYVVFVAVWTCGITLLEQMGGGGITIYSYMMLLMSVFTVLKPWQSLSVFGGAFFVFNILRPYFPVHPMIDITVNNSLNSLFISGIAIILSLYFNENRIINYSNKIIIDRQNKELSQMNDCLRGEIIIDSLTGLYNRRYLQDIVHVKFHDCIDKKKEAPLTCMMLDIDYFKQYNDTYGHQRGDECLRKIAEVMKKCLPMESAKIVRYGGEEFVIFIFNCDEELAGVYAEDLRGTIEKSRFSREDIEIKQITASLGVYTGIPDNKTNSEMRRFIKFADDALYAAKEAGRNCVRTHESKRVS